MAMSGSGPRRILCFIIPLLQSPGRVVGRMCIAPGYDMSAIKSWASALQLLIRDPEYVTVFYTEIPQHACQGCTVNFTVSHYS